MMTENEIRAFVEEATMVTGDAAAVTERITSRWLEDQSEAVEETRDATYDDAYDGWHGGE